MKLEIGMDSMLKLLREFIIQTGFAVWRSTQWADSSEEMEMGLDEYLWMNVCMYIRPVWKKMH